MNVTFTEAVKSFFANYANFKGRSTRAEYWWAILFIYIVSMVLTFLGVFGSILSGIFSLAVLVPSYAILTRRFHDVGLSGWWVVALVAVGIVVSSWIIGSMLPLFENIVANGGKFNPATFHMDPAMLSKMIFPCILGILEGIAVLVICLLPSGKGNKYGPNPYME